MARRAGAGKRDVKKGNNSANRMEIFRRVGRRYAARRTEVTLSRGGWTSEGEQRLRDAGVPFSEILILMMRLKSSPVVSRRNAEHVNESLPHRFIAPKSAVRGNFLQPVS